MKISLEEVASILGGTAPGIYGFADGVSIDSRTLRPGDLFFAIRGKRLDGHQYVSAAFERGAAAAVVESGFRGASRRALSGPLIRVPDTTQALQSLARAMRRRWGRPVVGITGSTGKTTTKEMAAAVLARRFRVLKSSGNLNNEYGVPLTLLSLEPEHEMAVLELAMSAPGEIGALTQLAEPQVGVVTNVAPVHLQFFDSIEGIERAKRELVEGLAPGSTAILNFDDRRVRTFGKGFKGEVLTFGFGEGADFRATDVEVLPDASMKFRVKGSEVDAEFRVPLPGRHSVQNALAAIAVGVRFKVPAEEMQEALREFKTLQQRCEILTLPSGVTLVNDSYNSNPAAMETMLETLAAWPGARRRIVLAGEMLELGPSSPEFHREVGRKCVRSGVEWLVAVRGDARYMLEGAREAGLPEAQSRFLETPEEAAEFVRKFLKSGDVLLVKGSRAVGLEKVIQLLRQFEN
jgi:UDP-N-acetylmuramoyl-tripeptide--D-alanyl-D-alanine ligase